MDVSWLSLLRALHVAAAALWFGGAISGLLVVGPAVQAAGKEGTGFLKALQARGGFARLFGPAAIVALSTGAIVYWQYGYADAPFATLPSALLTLGAIVAVATWTWALVVGGRIQRRLTALSKGADAPAAGAQAEIQHLQASMARIGRISAAGIAVAFILMVGRNVVV